MIIFIVINVVLCVITCFISYQTTESIGLKEKRLIFTTVCSIAIGLIAIVIPFAELLAIGIGIINILMFLVIVYKALFSNNNDKN